MSKSSIMIDIDDPRSAKIAEALANKSSKKILGLLSEGEMTGSEIASKLSAPLNTVTYNLKKLVEAGLVEKSNKMFWSSRGKRMEIYRLSNKRIIISPKRIVRGIVPALMVSLILALIIAISFPGSLSSQSDMAALPSQVQQEDNAINQRIVAQEDDVSVESFSAASGSSAPTEEAQIDVQEAIQVTEESYDSSSDLVSAESKTGFRERLYDAPNAWAWYLIGALTALLVFLLWNTYQNEKSSKEIEVKEEFK